MGLVHCTNLVYLFLTFKIPQQRQSMYWHQLVLVAAVTSCVIGAFFPRWRVYPKTDDVLTKPSFIPETFQRKGAEYTQCYGKCYNDGEG